MFCRISEDHLNGPGSLAERLRALPAYPPPPGGWNRLSARLAARRRRFAMAGSGLALAASVLVGVGLGLVQRGPAPQSAAASPAQSREVAQLISRSQTLERELATARPQAVVWSTGREERAAELERNLRVIDAQLNYARPDSAERLWRERVRAMNALVSLHKTQGPALQYASYQY